MIVENHSYDVSSILEVIYKSTRDGYKFSSSVQCSSLPGALHLREISFANQDPVILHLFSRTSYCIDQTFFFRSYTVSTNGFISSVPVMVVFVWLCNGAIVVQFLLFVHGFVTFHKEQFFFSYHIWFLCSAGFCCIYLVNYVRWTPAER